MEIFIGITAADKYKTLSADLGDDPLVSPARPRLRLASPLRARICKTDASRLCAGTRRGAIGHGPTAARCVLGSSASAPELTRPPFCTPSYARSDRWPPIGTAIRVSPHTPTRCTHVCTQKPGCGTGPRGPWESCTRTTSCRAYCARGAARTSRSTTSGCANATSTRACSVARCAPPSHLRRARSAHPTISPVRRSGLGQTRLRRYHRPRARHARSPARVSVVSVFCARIR